MPTGVLPRLFFSPFDSPDPDSEPPASLPVAPTPPGVEVTADPVTGDIHAVAGSHFRGVQFHAESILTEHGYDLIHDLVLELLAG